MHLELQYQQRALHSPARNAHQTWHERAALLVRLRARDGAWGEGEASPLPGYSLDTLAEAEVCLRAAPVRSLPEAAPADVERFLEQLATWPLTPAARFGLETALLTLWARRRGRSIRALFPAPSCALRGFSTLLSLEQPDPVARAQRLLGGGASALKVKLGVLSQERELALLHELRCRVSRPFALRLDCNGSLDVERARRLLPALTPLSPELLEEPVPAHDLLALAPPGYPLALDETLQRADALECVATASAQDLCQVLVLKPTTLGGFSGCLAWQRVAIRLGLDVVVTHAFEGPLAQAATRELAHVLGGPRAPGLSAAPASAMC